MLQQINLFSTLTWKQKAFSMLNFRLGHNANQSTLIKTSVGSLSRIGSCNLKRILDQIN